MPDPDKSRTNSTNGEDKPALWLRAIRHEASTNSTATTTLPDVRFTGTIKQNRVKVTNNQRALKHLRVKSVVNQTGGRVTVDYGHDSLPCDQSN